MVKHTQTIRRQLADELVECVCPFVKLALKGLLFYVRFFTKCVPLKTEV